MRPLLGVNIDHVATVRQARKDVLPDPTALALEAIAGGADGITAHLREDRRHIQKKDLINLKDRISVPLNMEMSIWPEIVGVAKTLKPAWVCLVPERRQELTTEGGLNVRQGQSRIRRAVEALHRAGCRVSFFIEPSVAAVENSNFLGADAVELHTGSYAAAFKKGPLRARTELKKIRTAALAASKNGLFVNAGHGIDYENVGALSKLFPFHEFNIGFSIVSRALVVGIRRAVKEMKERI